MFLMISKFILNLGENLILEGAPFLKEPALSLEGTTEVFLASVLKLASFFRYLASLEVKRSFPLDAFALLASLVPRSGLVFLVLCLEECLETLLKSALFFRAFNI